jgi:hypothetical protein
MIFSTREERMNYALRTENSDFASLRAVAKQSQTLITALQCVTPRRVARLLLVGSFPQITLGRTQVNKYLIMENKELG